MQLSSCRYQKNPQPFYRITGSGQINNFGKNERALEMILSINAFAVILEHDSVHRGYAPARSNLRSGHRSELGIALGAIRSGKVS